MKPSVLYPYRKAINNLFYRKEQIATFHTGRCGSTVLAYMLNDHSKIYWDSEPFEPYMKHPQNTYKKEFVENVLDLSRHREVSKIYGFETKYLPHQHLSHKCINMDIEDYILFLREINFSKFIVIQRKNYLRRVISAEVGRQTNRWHSQKDVTSPVKVTININYFVEGVYQGPILELFRIRDENFNRLKKLLSHDDALFLTYENDILDNPKVAYRKICDFIGVSDETPKIKLRRTNPFNYENLITNYAEVRAALIDTKYSWMLDD